MLTVTAPVGQRAAHGPQYQHSSTCMYALPVLSSMARESSGHMSTQRVQPSMHFDSSMVTGTSARWGAKGMAVSRKRLGKRSEGAVQQAAHGDAVAAEADELKVDRAAVGEVREAFQHEDGRAPRG